MPGNLLRKIRFRLNRVGRRVEQLWAEETNPTLVCCLVIRHSISMEHEEMDLVIRDDEAWVNYGGYERGSPPPPVTANQVCLPEATSLEAELRSLGLFELRSVQNMFDGSLTTIAARDSTHRHLFKENSIDTPQTRLRTFLLKLGRPPDQDDAVT